MPFCAAMKFLALVLVAMLVLTATYVDIATAACSKYLNTKSFNILLKYRVCQKFLANFDAL